VTSARISLSSWIRLLIPPTVIAGVAVATMLFYASSSGVPLNRELVSERPVLMAGVAAISPAVAIASAMLGLGLTRLSRRSARVLSDRVRECRRSAVDSGEPTRASTEYEELSGYIADLARRRVAIGASLQQIRELLSRVNAASLPADRARLVAVMIQSRDRLSSELDGADRER